LFPWIDIYPASLIRIPVAHTWVMHCRTKRHGIVGVGEINGWWEISCWARRQIYFMVLMRSSFFLCNKTYPPRAPSWCVSTVRWTGAIIIIVTEARWQASQFVVTWFRVVWLIMRSVLRVYVMTYLCVSICEWFCHRS
jgi:hypothetical protein